MLGHLSTLCLLCFFFNDTATTEIYTLSLHDALPIYTVLQAQDEQGNTVTIRREIDDEGNVVDRVYDSQGNLMDERVVDRKSTRLNSSHANISYAVFCLKKKNIIHQCIAYPVLSPCAP